MRLLQQTSVTVLSRWSGFVLDGVTSIVVARYIGPAGKSILAALSVIAGLATGQGETPMTSEEMVEVNELSFTVRDQAGEGSQ